VPFWISGAVLFAAACIIAITGGFRTSIASLQISVQRPAMIAVAAWITVVLGARRMDHAFLAPQLIRVRAWAARRATQIVLVVAACTALAALLLGAQVAAGADPYGYVSQSKLWTRGNPVQLQTALALEAPWPNAASAFCPLGYRPSHVPGVIAPTYAVGLPLQMAASTFVLGPRGVWVVVPLLGGLVVFLAYRFACGIGSSPAWAAASAILVAASPVFLFQLLQPMSDVPVAAWWLFSLVAALDAPVWAALGSGLCASMAILTRPNLVPLVVPVAAYLWWRHRASRRSAPRIAAFLAGIVPGVALTAAANTVFYGSPATSGYGRLNDIYRASYLVENLTRYPGWLIQTHTLFIAAALLPLLIVPFKWDDASGRAGQLIGHASFIWAFALALFACYVFYLPFDHWTYLRFLLPAIPVLLVLATTSVEILTVRLSIASRAAIALAIIMVLPLSFINFAVRGDAFALKRLFIDRYVTAAARIATETPTHAVVICLLQSGSLNLYSDRLTVRYDLIPAEWLGRAIGYLERKGREPYVALEKTEVAGFVERFGAESRMLAGSRAVSVDPLGLVTLWGPVSEPRR
jgi:hypothetical protein